MVIPITIPHNTRIQDPLITIRPLIMAGTKHIGKIIRKIILETTIEIDHPMNKGIQGGHHTRHGQRGRSPMSNYEHGYRDRGGPSQGQNHPYEHSPIPTHNYYAPLRDHHEEERDERYYQTYYQDPHQNRSFLGRGTENYPPGRTDESRLMRRSPGRSEDVDQERENKLI